MPSFLFAHGAGAPSTHPWMQAWRRRLETLGAVDLFDYSFAQPPRKRPDPLPRLVEEHRSALARWQVTQPGPVLLAGKSLGARVGCHLALEEQVAGIICFGYPLCGNGDRTRLRAKVLLELSTPILFIQGTRDPLCPVELLEDVRKRMQAPSECCLVEGGDHSLLVTKRQLRSSGQSQEDVDQAILRAIWHFMLARTGR